MKINTKSIASAVATTSLIMSAFAQTAFAATTEISGNGAHSINTALQTNNSTTTVVQSNSADISNNISSNANTGGNDANANTGGSVTITTGNAATGVSVSNAANLNQASLPCACLTSGGNSPILISGNGAGSDNFAATTNNNDTQAYQNNYANFNNWVDANAKTGHNDANANTGPGSVTITTGNALSQVGVSNAANANVLSLGSGTGTGNGNGTWGAGIVGNGADSFNTALVDNSKSVLVTQSNSAFFNNWVDSNAKTGGNDANANTGGSVAIRTGAATSGVAVDNLANFNSADVSCGCLVGNGGSLLISGNGAHSDSFASSSSTNDTSIFQDNPWAWLNNNVDGDAKTGHNDSNANTGSVWGGSSFTTVTGAGTSVTGVSNSANLNSVGPTLSLPGGLSLGFHWNLSSLWSFFHLV